MKKTSLIVIIIGLSLLAIFIISDKINFSRAAGNSSPAGTTIPSTLPTFAKYDLQEKKVPGTYDVPFRPDSITKVWLPAGKDMRVDSSVDVLTIFVDGRQFIIGPDRDAIWLGDKLANGSFTLQGLKEAGVAIVTLANK